MDTTKWMARLTQASTSAEVLDLVNQYLASRDPQVIASIRPNARSNRCARPMT